MKIYTIGHSTHSQEEFVSILKKYNIGILVDVRSFPASNYVPHFNKENIEKWLMDNKIKYIHMKKLGGRRGVDKSVDESLIDGWQSQSFRNYASYSLTNDYEEGIEYLISLSKKDNLAYMCSEAVPWRCHRLLISNTLVSKDIEVYHIMGKEKLIKHKLGLYGANAIVKNNKVIYPSKLKEDGK